MRAGGSSEKGGKFERDVCRRLSLWVTDGKNPNVFWRSATSGARATVQLRTGVVNRAQSGDICAVDPAGFPFVEANFVEIKHRKDLGIGRFLVCNTGILAGFWEKTRREAEKYGKRPLLIACQNYYPTLALVDDASGIFDDADPEPVIMLRSGIWAYLFDEATSVRTKMVRRAAFGMV